MNNINIKKNLPALFAAVTLLVAAACNASAPQTESVPTASPTPGGLPQSEAGVPRVSAEEAKAAFDSGQAVIVDVRSPDAYARAHIAGAIFIPLGEIETNPAGINLDEQQWIITYCT